MTRDQIRANTKTGAERLASGKYGVTPRNPKHVRRILELKKKAREDEAKRDAELAAEMPVALRA